jgi:hypothetical protein
MTKYLTCAETAKLVRAALKEAFPGVKFSVKSSVYAGGASINIAYTDGPSASQVKGITQTFQGAYFDGMTDYKGSNYNTLDGQEVRFGADFIFVNRKFTAPMLTGVVVEVCNKYGFDNEILIDSGGEYFGAYIKAVGPNADSLVRGYNTNDIDRIIREEASQCSAIYAAEFSPTLARVAFLGDDGYGYGAVGRLAA